MIKDLLQQADLPGDSAALDAQLLLAHVLNKPRSYLYAWSDAEVSAQQQAEFEQLVQHRREGVPVAHLLGYREFWSMELWVNEHTLIPRPETECLVDCVLGAELPDDAHVLELGTGTGAIALALKQERAGWDITAVDISTKALATAKENAQRLNLEVRFLVSDWFSALSGKRYNAIISNPPYVAENDRHLSEGDVRFEPLSALVSGQDGLDDIRKITSTGPDYLTTGGILVLEHGCDQGAAVRALMPTFSRVTTHQDLAGLDRFTVGVLT